MKKMTKLIALALVLALSVVMLASCFGPNADPEKAIAALKENGKYVECNSQFFNSPKATEKFRRQYAEFLRELFEMGIPLTYGSDSHNQYAPAHVATEKYLLLAGFADGDLSDLDESALW